MSAGQGDQMATNKSGESEISSSSEGGGTVTAENMDNGSAEAEGNGSETSEAAKDITNLSTSVTDEKQGTGTDISCATNTDKLIEEKIPETPAGSAVDNSNADLTPIIEAQVTNITQNPCQNQESEDTDLDNPKQKLSEDTTNQVEDLDKANSSFGDELVLKWDDDDDENEGVASAITQTDDLLKLLDKEIGEGEHNDDRVKTRTEHENIPELIESKDNDKEKIESVCEIANDSLEESQRIIDEIDNLTQDTNTNTTKNDADKVSTQDIEMKTTVSSDIVSSEKPVTDNKEIEKMSLGLPTDISDNPKDNDDEINKQDQNTTDATKDVTKSNQNSDSEDVPRTADIHVLLDVTTIPTEDNKCKLTNTDVTVKENKLDLTDKIDSEMSGNINKEVISLDTQKEEIKTTLTDLDDIKMDTSNDVSKQDTNTLEHNKPGTNDNSSLTLEIADNSSKEVSDDITAIDETIIEKAPSNDANISEKHDKSDLQDTSANKTSKLIVADDKPSNMEIDDSALSVDDKTSEKQTIDSETTVKVDDTPSINTADVISESQRSDDKHTIDESVLDATISPNKHHRINMPNVMLDIPTQELSDIEAELSDSDVIEEIEKSKETIDIAKVIEPSTPIKDDIDGTSSLLPSKSQESIHTEDKASSNIEKLSGEISDDKTVSSTNKMSDEIPSTSKDVDDKQSTSVTDEKAGKHTSDHTDEVQESDSLGLLAESSRVMDDDCDDDEDDAEEPEPDDNDDDDFDPYDESSSQMLEDTDDSNPAPEKSKPASPRGQSDEGTSEVPVTSDFDDIECVENELPDIVAEDAAADTTTDDKKEKAQETEAFAADKQTDKTEDPDKIKNILEKVLGNVSDKAKSHGKVLNYVEVEGSSDSDDVQEVSKPEKEARTPLEVTSGGSELSNKGPVVSVPKTAPETMAKIGEVTIPSGEKPLESITEAKVQPEKAKEEVFNLDSDDDDDKKPELESKTEEKESSPKLPDKARKCINPACTSGEPCARASRAVLAFYSQVRRAGAVCGPCRRRAGDRTEALVEGIKDLRPLLDLEMDAPSHQLVEISDSDDDDDAFDDSEKIGEKGAKFLEDNLADVFNETWLKYNMDSRLNFANNYILEELKLIEAGVKELDAMFDKVQIKTDAIRSDFYKDYDPRRKCIGGIIICDTPFSSYSHTEKDFEEGSSEIFGSRYPKRRSASNLADPPTKRQALDAQGVDNKLDDDKDLTVVNLSNEVAPSSLPPFGDLVRPPVQPGMLLYAMRHAFGTWTKAKVMDVQETKAMGFTQCKVKFEHKVKNPCKVLAARCLAYTEPSAVRLPIGTRVIALFKDPQNAQRKEAFYAGVVAELPNPLNKFRYLVFFDDGYAQYIQHADARLVCESSALVWEEVHPFIREFIRSYLQAYPERPMVRLRQGETLNTEWNGKWWISHVLQVEASIALIHFDVDGRTEWIYRGSSRLEPLYLELQAAAAPRSHRLQRSKARANMPCVEYTRCDEQANAKAAAEAQAQKTEAEEFRRQRAVAKKSTTDRQASVPTPASQGSQFDGGVLSRVVYYTPKNAVKPLKMSPHSCSGACRRADLLALRDLRTYNPLAKPLLSGWERQTVRYKGHREVMYRAPCGRRLRNMQELHKYLRILQSDLSVDLFDFTPGTHCLAEFVLNKCLVGKKDLSHGKENVPVPCVNYYDHSLPEFCSYNTERTPTAGVPLNLDPDFLCGCDCTDDCEDKSKCACWKMTLEGARTIGLEGDNVGYVYRRLPEPLPSGIYECNSRCKCKKTCLNRVAQHPLQLKLQVFKTINRGWGIRALNDVPKGSFICVYAGNLLTDATANLDGLNEGDEYLAELDYIEVVESMKEGYEDDVPEADKALDKKSSDSDSEPTSESEEEKAESGEDKDFQPAYIPQPLGPVPFQKSLRKREKAKMKEEKRQEDAKKKEDCITISDDEEVREPSRFTAAVATRGRRSARRSVRELFGEDEACYIVDAKVQGNIGRYLNHSCHPNVFVQNVFVDTHDPRFPWVAFFALAHVRAGAELTWNYNYDVGSVPGKVLYCYCGAPNCRGRLL